MPTSLEHGPKYKFRKINRVRHALEIRTNGTRHNIPNTNHLREKGGKKEGGLNRVHNQKVETACSLPSAGDRSNIILRVPRSNHKEQGKFKDNIIK